MESHLRGHDAVALWKSVLTEREVVGSQKVDVPVYVSDRRNLLTQNLQQLEDSVWQADVVCPAGTSAWATVNQFLTWDKEHVVAQEKIRWQHEVMPQPDTQYW